MRTRSRKYVVKGWRLRGDVARARRMWDDADHALREALAVAEFIGNPTQLWLTHTALAALQSQRNAPDAARQAHDAARGVIEHVKSGLQNPRLRASLQGASHLRRMYDSAATDYPRPTP